MSRAILKNTPFQINDDKVAISVRTDNPAKLSYSVDGITNWTEHPTPLAPRANVICNIPRNLFLKVSEPIVITEA